MDRFRLLYPALALLFAAAAITVTTIGCSAEDASDGVRLFSAHPDHAYARVEQASVRLEPVSIASEVAFLELGERLQILRRSSEKVRIGPHDYYWYRVRLESGVEGWVYGFNISYDGSTAQHGRFSEEYLQSYLVGKWWELRADGTTGRARIYFWPDGVYRHGRPDASGEMAEGRYEILAQERVVVLDSGSRLGDRLTISEAGRELRLSGNSITLRRGDDDPDRPEMTFEQESESEQEEQPTETGRSPGSEAQ